MSSFQDWLMANQDKTLGAAKQTKSLPFRHTASKALEASIRGGRPLMGASPLGFLMNLVLPSELGDSTTMPKQVPTVRTQQRMNERAQGDTLHNPTILEDVIKLRNLGLSPVTPPGN